MNTHLSWVISRPQLELQLSQWCCWADLYSENLAGAWLQWSPPQFCCWLVLVSSLWFCLDSHWLLCLPRWVWPPYWQQFMWVPCRIYLARVQSTVYLTHARKWPIFLWMKIWRFVHRSISSFLLAITWCKVLSTNVCIHCWCFVLLLWLLHFN